MSHEEKLDQLLLAIKTASQHHQVVKSKVEAEVDAHSQRGELVWNYQMPSWREYEEAVRRMHEATTELSIYLNGR